MFGMSASIRIGTPTMTDPEGRTRPLVAQRLGAPGAAVSSTSTFPRGLAAPRSTAMARSQSARANR
jgi:hypothetical protein